MAKRLQNVKETQVTWISFRCNKREQKFLLRNLNGSEKTPLHHQVYGAGIAALRKKGKYL